MIAFPLFLCYTVVENTKNMRFALRIAVNREKNMAKFNVKRIKYGYEGRSMSEYISIESIQFEEGDEVIVLPSEFEGEKITHFGYGQAFTKAHEEWADWHHPSKGSDWVPDEYHFDYMEIRFPESVKKLVIPATIKDIAFSVPKYLKTLTIEVEEGNERYKSIDGVLCYVHNDKPVVG